MRYALRAIWRSHDGSAWRSRNFIVGGEIVLHESALKPSAPVESQPGSVIASSAIETVIGDIVVRAVADTNEAHLRRVIRSTSKGPDTRENAAVRLLSYQKPYAG